MSFYFSIVKHLLDFEDVELLFFYFAVENDNLMRSNSQLFEKDNDNDFDLISTESLVIPDYEKDDSSHSIPTKSSSIK